MTGVQAAIDSRKVMAVRMYETLRLQIYDFIVQIYIETFLSSENDGTSTLPQESLYGPIF